MTENAVQPDASIEAERGISGLADAYLRIRQAILEGEFSPGSRVSQVKIAEDLGLSRTPVREALRMIEREGLILSTHGRQVVISPTSMADLDELYALRIKLDTTTVRLTVPLLTVDDIAEMRSCMMQMISNEDEGNFNPFDAAHRQFHMIAIRSAGPRHIDYSAHLNEHAERYRRLYLVGENSYKHSRAEHSTILAACEQRNGDAVAHLLAEHYARNALTIVAQIEPAFEPTLVRSAVRAVVQDRSGPSRKSEADKRAGGQGGAI